MSKLGDDLKCSYLGDLALKGSKRSGGSLLLREAGAKKAAHNKLIAVIAYIVVGISIEFLNQYAYKAMGNFPVTIPLFQWLFIAFMYPILATLGSRYGGLLGKFVMEFELKKYLIVWDSGLLFSANLAIQRIIACQAGAGRMDVVRALGLPMTCLICFAYDGQKQNYMCAIGVAAMTFSFLMYFRGSQDLHSTHLILGLVNGFLTSHYTWLTKRRMESVGGNAMLCMWYHLPWYIVGLTVTVMINGENLFGRFLSYGSPLSVAVSTTGVDADGVFLTSIVTMQDCYGLVDCLSMQESKKFWLLFVLIIGGLLLQVSTMFQMQNVSPVTSQISSQTKTTLVAVMGFVYEYVMGGATYTLPLNAYLATTVKFIGSGCYTYGKIHAMDTKQPIAARSAKIAIPGRIEEEEYIYGTVAAIENQTKDIRP